MFKIGDLVTITGDIGNYSITKKGSVGIVVRTNTFETYCSWIVTTGNVPVSEDLLFNNNTWSIKNCDLTKFNNPLIEILYGE